MKKIIQLFIVITFLLTKNVFSQDCKTSADLDTMPGKYLTAAEYPWPAVRAEYFKKMTTPADKAMAKQTLAQLEKIEQQSRNGFTLTGGNWENIYSTDDYGYFGNSKLGQYTFQSAFYEYFCSKGKAIRNTEYGTVLRMYVNKIPTNTLSRFLNIPFSGAIGEYDLNLQYKDWKNHKPTEPNAQLISLYSFLSCRNTSLIEAINSGDSYFQDIDEKDVKPNNRTHVYRYWFVKKNNLPVLLPVSRKEYLQSLLEFYEREKLYFPMLMTKFAKEKNSDTAKYNNWEADVNDKIGVVKKALTENKEEWLAAQAIVNRIEDASLAYKAKLNEKTNHNRFWKFYDTERGSEPLYQYNPEYFKSATSAAKPQIISIVFRYITFPSSLRLLNNFTKNFDFAAVKKMME